MRYGKLTDRLNMSKRYVRFCHRCGEIFSTKLPNSRICIKCFKPNGLKTAKKIAGVSFK